MNPPRRLVPLFLSSVALLMAVTSGVGCLKKEEQRPYRPPFRNVLLISMDTTRADHLSCYGYTEKTTPNLEALAAEGILFEHVVTPVPLTLPSHCTMLTGTNPPYHGVRLNLYYRLDASNQTLAELLHDQGFATGAIVSGTVLDSRFGLNQGFDSYQDSFEDELDAHGFTERRGGETTQLALQWLEEMADEQFFLFLHYFDPHHEYEPPEPYAAKFKDNPYAGEIAFTDDCIGQVLQRLKELGLYESTLIIVIGDHGEMLGEHGELTHSYFVYESALRVPLIFRFPGSGPPRRIPSLAGIIDVVPTVCSLLGIETPPQVAGLNLAPLLLGTENAHREERSVYFESLTAEVCNANWLQGIVSHDGWKFIDTTRPELYNLTSDPEEAHNLVDNDTQRALAMREQLMQIVEAQTPSENTESGLRPDPELQSKLESLGYIGGGARDDIILDSTKDDPKDLISVYRITQAAAELHARGEYDESEALCRVVIDQRPDVFVPYRMLSKIATSRKDYLAANKYLRKSLELKPDDPDAHYELGVGLHVLGEIDEAIEHYILALEKIPHHSKALFNLGAALEVRGEYENAARHYRLAIEIDDAYADPRCNLAWHLATHPDPNVRDAKEALDLAQQAHALDRNVRPQMLDTLAAALAAAGKFDRAVDVARQAAEAAKDALPQQEVQAIRERLELYKEGKPYHRPTDDVKEAGP